MSQLPPLYECDNMLRCNVCSEKTPVCLLHETYRGKNMLCNDCMREYAQRKSMIDDTIVDVMRSEHDNKL